MKSELGKHQSTEIFNYRQVDDSTADFLRLKEANIVESGNSLATYWGEQLTEARERLASHDKYEGVYGKWCVYMGFNREKANRLTNRYELVRLSDDVTRDVIEGLSITLSEDIAKPSAESTPAKAQAKEEVLAGEIETSKAYKERIAELEKINKQKEDDNNNLSKKLHEVENKPTPEPTVVEVEKIIEIDNTDYSRIEALRLQNEELTRQVETNERRLSIAQREAKLYKEGSEEFDRMREEIAKLTNEKDSIGRQMQEAGDIGKLAAHVENTLKQMSPYAYVVEDIANDVALNSLFAIIDKVKECLVDIEDKAGRYKSHVVRSNSSIIIDAEIIN